MSFLEKFNTDDVFFRGVIIGLLSKLNETITYNQVGSDGISKIVFIPFFYSQAGDESFLQDFYLSYEDCDGKPAFAEGNYDVIPRGIIEFTSSRIDTSAATTKFVRGSYTKEVEKEIGSEMITYSAYLNPIPISVTISCKIKADTTLDAFKIQQSTLEILYKRFVYYFSYKGVRVPVQASLTDSTGEKTPNNFSFGYGTQRGEGVTLAFTIELETYLPQFDLTTERFRGNLMQSGIKINVEFGKTPEDNSTIIQGIGVYGAQNDIK
jgi:hypothetical protein